MPELAYLNGKISPIEETRVPVNDRGYQFGDAVYEVIASYNGKLFCQKEHLDRLERSMELLSYPPMDRTELEEQVEALFVKAGIPKAMLYIQISRGVAPRDHAYAKNMALQHLMTVREYKGIPGEVRDKGVAVITVEDVRWAKCHIKTVQLLPNAMAKQQAKDAGVFDAVFVAPDGVVREGSSSNFFLVQGDRLITHPLTHHILPGITRHLVMELAEDIGLKTEERFFELGEVFAGDEAFLTGTTTEVLGVVDIDGKVIGTGKPGAITRKLHDGLKKKAE